MYMSDKFNQVLVTGGVGFIGHHLVARLAGLGYCSVIIDNLSNGRISNLRGIDRRYYQVVKCDIRNFAELQEKLRNVSPKFTFHLAALHFIPYCIEHRGETTAVNIQGTKNILKISESLGVKKFIFASSAAVYRSSAKAHKEEEKTMPIDIYGRTKQLGEEIVKRVAKENHRCDYTIFRIFNVYGPLDLTPHFIPEMIKKIRRDKVVKVGNLKTKRDYVHVVDVVEAFTKIIETKEVNRHSIYNIGAGRSVSGYDIVRMIAACFGKRIILKEDNLLMRKMGHKELLSDTSRFSADFKWKPRIKVNKGIRQLCKT